ncbi:hypothetical protein [Burkholderia ambifaria]|uniref:hypothetical protein n=2 Tax=Burkholderia ambifaria TaxID=152480 RepID=UPI00158B912A|nr:hypothetical protein [Burkholderia ambifaria]
MLFVRQINRMAEQHKPGEKVRTSCIYKVVKVGDGGSGFEVTDVEGDHFPSTRSGEGQTT